MKDISILIPTYNHTCVELVGTLQRQASLLPVSYEIIVADDGSTDVSTIEANRAINDFTNSRYIERPENAGRAAIRNYLARQASMPWVLFIDSDMVVCRDDFLCRYVETADQQAVWDGGITVGGDAKLLNRNLRYRYERAAEHLHTAERRQQAPYRDFHTANFMVPRSLMDRCAFDLHFRHYGYEDVLFGKQLQQQGVPILHIDNPLSFEVFEANGLFLDKTEEGLRTLFQFRSELDGYSRLLDRSKQLPRAPFMLAHRLLGPLVRRLLERYPVLPLFTFYRLCYFMSIK